MPAIADRPIEKYILTEGPKTITSKRQHAAYVSWLLGLQRQKNLKGKDLDTAKVLVLVNKDYESRQFPAAGAASPTEVLEELMSANNLQQKDLAPIFGGESLVSLVLSAQRKLSKHHIEKLTTRFNVSPAVFFDSAK